MLIGERITDSNAMTRHLIKEARGSHTQRIVETARDPDKQHSIGAIPLDQVGGGSGGSDETESTQFDLPRRVDVLIP